MTSLPPVGATVTLTRPSRYPGARYDKLTIKVAELHPIDGAVRDEQSGDWLFLDSSVALLAPACPAWTTWTLVEPPDPPWLDEAAEAAWVARYPRGTAWPLRNEANREQVRRQIRAALRVQAERESRG